MKKSMVVMHVHKDIYPNTDHGYTWTEKYWFLLLPSGEPISPIIPSGGACERLCDLPGGPVDPRILEEDLAVYKPDKIVRTEKVHPDYHKVTKFGIRPAK